MGECGGFWGILGAGNLFDSSLYADPCPLCNFLISYLGASASACLVTVSETNHIGWSMTDFADSINYILYYSALFFDSLAYLALVLSTLVFRRCANCYFRHGKRSFLHSMLLRSHGNQPQFLNQ